MDERLLVSAGEIFFVNVMPIDGMTLCGISCGTDSMLPNILRINVHVVAFCFSILACITLKEDQHGAHTHRQYALFGFSAKLGRL